MPTGAAGGESAAEAGIQDRPVPVAVKGGNLSMDSHGQAACADGSTELPPQFVTVLDTSGSMNLRMGAGKQVEATKDSSEKLAAGTGCAE